MRELNQELARAAYDNHLAAAQALPAERVLEFRLDVDLAINNIQRAMLTLEAFREQIPIHLPLISIADIESLPSLALATKLSALMVQSALPATVPAAEIIAEGWKLRAILMPVVESLAAVGAIPRQVYDHIYSGRGARDMAADCVALSQVFRDYEAQVAGKHGADPAVIARAAVVGSWLLQNMRAKRAARVQVSAAEVDIRDRLATLLVERYKSLRIVGYYFHGDEVNDHVPPLMSRLPARKREAEEAEPAPAEA